MRDRATTPEKHGRKDAGYAPRFDRTGAAVRELQTPNERGDPASAAPAPDHWSGSKHVVQVRPHVWNWLAPRIGGGAVLEIGPGLRPTAPVATSTFIDASPHALRSLAARGATTAAVEGALPFPDDAFDAVLAFEVIEHVHDDTGLIGEMARVSRPGGVLILSTPVHATMWSPLDEACGHVRRDEPPTLFEKVRAAGFEIGGYSWTPAPSRLLTGIRARALRTNRRLSTAFVQTLVFPIHAASQRMFTKVKWRAPADPVPGGADDVMLWARRVDHR
jgi:SAM-dependent methyltransferase